MFYNLAPWLGIDGLVGVTWVLLRWSCSFSAALEVGYFWQLSLADAPLHLQILMKSDSLCRHPAKARPGVPESLGAALPNQAKKTPSA